MDFLILYKAYCEQITDAPPNYHDFIGIATVGIALGNRCHLPFGDSRIYPNIWMIILGNSSISRKTTSMNIGKRLLNEVCPETIFPNEFSTERIQGLLENRPAGCFFFSEFIALTGLLQRDYMSGAKGFLADLFDSPFSYKRETERKTISIKNPAISIVSATTQSWFMERMRESDLLGRFLPRFLMITPEKKRTMIALPPEADKEKRHALVKELREILSMEGVFSISQEAKKYFEDWYRILMELPVTSRTDAFVNRLQVYALKFAMILNVIKQKNLHISRESMKQACDMMYAVFRSLTAIEKDDLVFGRVQNNMRKIIDCLRRNGGRLPKSALLNNTHLSSKEFAEAITTLREMERVKLTKERTAKKPVEFYELAEEISTGTA